MKAIELDQEMRDLFADEEVLAYFDCALALRAAEAGAGRVDGLCKISRPRARRSRSTYLSLIFIFDAPDAPTQAAVAAHVAAIEWASCTAPGIDCVLAIPHRDASAGLFLKEIDVYLDGNRPPTPEFLREVLQPAVARVMGVVPGALTVWEAAEQPPPAPSADDTLLGRLRRLAGRG